MKISVAQTLPVAGDIAANIENHLKLIHLAVDEKADMIIFPELSITGYEPKLARELVTSQSDTRFDIFQKISDLHHITIGFGAPTPLGQELAISMILFQPESERQTFLKRFLHHTETPFFVPGDSYNGFHLNALKIAIAICYEVSVPEHAEYAARNEADFYVASIVEDNADNAIAKLSDIAAKYGMVTLMANCVGQTGGYSCPGKSSIWDNTGKLIGQLEEPNEGILILDTESGEVTTLYQIAETV